MQNGSGRFVATLLVLAASVSAQDPHPTFESDTGIQAELLKELNALADAGKTTTAAALLATRPATRPEVALAEPATAILDGERLYRRLREGTVIVGGRYKCKKCTHWHLNTASGFLISRDGVVVTNRHVLAAKDLEAMAVMDGGGKVHAVLELLAQDEVHDVALIRIAGDGHRPLPLARTEPAPGAEVSVLSHPNNRYWMYTVGNVSRIAEWADSKAPQHRFPVLCITAPFAPGSSGGPVTDRAGNVLGIATRIQPVMQPKSDDGHKPEKEGEPKPAAEEYTAMVIPMAVPVRWVREAIAPAPENR